MGIRARGLTVVEVLIALTIVGVVVAVLSTMTVSSVRHDANSGSRTQAAQVLSYLGRLASASDPTLLSGDREWGYGELQGTFVELRTEARHANPALYRARVEALGGAGIAGSSVELYRVTVCWLQGGDEHCVDGETAGPPLPPEGGEDLPPVVN